jgi:hypothetical protein
MPFFSDDPAPAPPARRIRAQILDNLADSYRVRARPMEEPKNTGAGQAAAPRRATIMEPTSPGFFDQDLPAADELRLQPLREGCRGRAYIYDCAPTWNNNHVVPGLRLRYNLFRDWGTYDAPQEAFVAFLGMNPGRADGQHDDHTSRIYIEFAQRMGFKSYCALNVTPCITTYPDDLLRPDWQPWIVQPAHQSMLSGVMGQAAQVVVCFGTLPPRRVSPMRDEAIRITSTWRGLNSKPLLCFGTTKDGSPRHLSRLAYDTPLVTWSGM